MPLVWLKSGGGRHWRGTGELRSPSALSMTSESAELPSPRRGRGVGGDRKLRLLKKGMQLPAGPCGLPEDQTRRM